MGKNDHRSRDQKRKAKLKKRAERSSKHESLAYHGKKYKAAEYVPIMHRTEIGIYEAYVMCDRVLTDDDVEEALERLIIQMRQNALLPPATDDLTLTSGDEGELIVENIRRNWRIMAENGVLVPKDDLIGVLRTILHSLEIWRLQSLHSRGYLHFLEGFMKETGVSVKMIKADQITLPEPS